MTSLNAESVSMTLGTGKVDCCECVCKVSEKAGSGEYTNKKLN